MENSLRKAQGLCHGCTGTGHQPARRLQKEILLGFHLQLTSWLHPLPSNQHSYGKWPVVDVFFGEFM